MRQLGKLTHYSHVYVWELETGRKPPQPDFIAACDRHLQAGGQLITLAANRRLSMKADDQEFGLDFPIDWREGIDTVTKLWRHDAGRRRFLRDAAFVSSAYAMPAQRWLALLNSDGASGPDAEPANAEYVRAMTSTFRRLDNLYGGGQLRTAVAQYLDAEVAPILRNSCDIVDLQAALDQQLLYVPIGQVEPQIPAHRDHDHLGRKPESGER